MQNGVKSDKDMDVMINLITLELTLADEDFPNQYIRNNWFANMNHFAKHFKKIDFEEQITEQPILYQIDDIWFQGYIDIVGKKDGKVYLLDWKTSSQFRGDNLIKMGRQLALYQDALEQMADIDVDFNGWYMTKYADLVFDGRSKTLQRKDIASKSRNKIEKSLHKEDELLKQIYLTDTYVENSLDVLPDYAREQFEIKPHIKEYKVDDKVILEAREYVKDTVSKIENENDWKPCDIKENEFFCYNLCNYRNSCPYLDEYILNK